MFLKSELLTDFVLITMMKQISEKMTVILQTISLTYLKNYVKNTVIFSILEKLIN